MHMTNGGCNSNVVNFDAVPANPLMSEGVELWLPKTIFVNWKNMIRTHGIANGKWDVAAEADSFKALQRFFYEQKSK